MRKNKYDKRGVTNLTRLNKRNYEGVILRFLPLAARSFGVTVLHETLPPYTDTPPNLHKHTHEYVFVLSGQATAYLNRRYFQIKEGDMFAIPAGVAHRFKSGKKQLTALSVFSPAINFKHPDVHLLRADASNRRLAALKK
ncbi:MAG: cupin domain-containing protein [Elusimicrobiota bacterium]